MKTIFSIFLLSILLVPVLISAQSKKTNTRGKQTAKIQYGTASFYSDKFEGKKTASGERYSAKKFTAAHNSLPLGTWIKVTNVKNSKSVTVKVNDRLHKNNPRLVDLSKAAAKKLGYGSNGLTKVKVEVLGKKKPVDASAVTNK